MTTTAAARPECADAVRPRNPAPGATLIALGVALAVLAAYLVVWVHLSRAQQTGSDYSAFHVAALLWRDGHGGQLYNQSVELSLHATLMPAGYHADLPFISPPTVALLSAPLTWLDLGAAFRVASMLQLAMAALAVAVALRAAPRRPGRTGLEALTTGAVALAGTGTLVLVLLGQWDGFCALGLALAYACWRRDRPGLAGLALALTFAPTKPHIALGLAAFLVGMRQARALGGAAAGVAVAFGAGLLVAGLQGWGDWLGSLTVSSGHSPLPSLLGFTGFFGSWLGDTGAARALAGGATVIAVGACAVLGDRVRREPTALEPALAGAAALSLAAAPHLLMHDLVVLAPAAAWTLAWAAASPSPQRHRRALAAWLLLNLAALLDLGNSSSAPPGRLVPVALVALGCVALSVTAPQRARTPRSPSPATAATYSCGSGVGGVVDQS